MSSVLEFTRVMNFVFLKNKRIERKEREKKEEGNRRREGEKKEGKGTRKEVEKRDL